jgi:general secretion pathway protein C
MIVLQYIKKHLWLINLAFVLCSAYLTANLVNLHLSAKINIPPQIDLVSAKIDSNAKPAMDDFQVILNRNIFNSAAVRQQLIDKIKEGLNISTADLDLVGTMAGSPQVSLALIGKRSEGGKVDVYYWGDKIGEYEISMIERRQVHLVKDGTEEILKMPDDRKAFKFNTDISIENIADGIKKIGDDEIIVDRRVIESSFDNFGKLMRQARIVPNFKGGKIEGFKVYRIKKDSLFSQIGLINGDVIRRVNGNEIAGPEDGLKLFEIFKTAKSIKIELDRKGAKKTLSYTVR